MALAPVSAARKGRAAPVVLGAAAGPRAAAARRDWERGTRLARENRLDAAAQAFERAARAQPDEALYWLNLANVQRKLKQEGPALDSARQAFAADSSNRLACHLLVELLRHHNRLAEALAVLDSLHADTPRDANHWWLQGDLLFSLNRAEPAAQALLQVLALQPGHLDAYMKLGFSLAWLKQYGSAAECFRAVTMMDPSQVGAAVYAAHYAAWACDWVQGADDLARMDASLARYQGQALAPPTSPFCLVAIDDHPQQQRVVAEREAARLVRQLAQRTQWPAEVPGADPHAAARAVLAQGRCRIGFVGCDFRDHATSILMVRLVELLDRAQFEVLLYSHGEDDGSALRQRLQAGADQFVDCRHLSAAEQAQRIRDDGVALLVDLGGFTLNSRLQMFALRPAPVQASWLAFPGTVGADFIDYIVGDPVVTPLAHADDFTEKIVQLPVSYQANDALRAHPETTLSRTEAGLPEDVFVFACFNQSYKITADTFASWCRVLQQVPDSVLWLLVPQDEVQARLRLAAEQHGLAPERLVFAPFVSQAEHLARLPLADLALDTFPCGAHTTCSDALWMGLPLVTRMGRSFASRVAGSLLNAVSLAPLATHSAEDYETVAVRLAHDRELLTEVRDHLWDSRRDLALFDSEAFAQDFGQAAWRMVQRWQQGLAPDHLPSLEAEAAESAAPGQAASVSPSAWPDA